ncbi:MAG: hypothetical protein PV340_02845 [Wolbachia sp.]|nr:hypothetical protein [Wolbachia sp.]MDD9335882.1 hypothetical protein [Wolbachia sp.]
MGETLPLLGKALSLGLNNQLTTKNIQENQQFTEDTSSVENTTPEPSSKTTIGSTTELMEDTSTVVPSSEVTVGSTTE